MPFFIGLRGHLPQVLQILTLSLNFMDHKFLLKWEQLYKIIANNLAAVRKGSIITPPPTLRQVWNSAANR